jgi:hypothetical protein
VIVLTLLTLFQIGKYNDLVLRASIPALFCLAVCVGKAVHLRAVGLWTRVALMLALLLGSVTTVAEMEYHALGIYSQLRGVPNEDAFDKRGIVTVYETRTDELIQYIGGYASPFFQYVAKVQPWVEGNERYIAFADHKILYASSEWDASDVVQAGDRLLLMTKFQIFFAAIHKNYNMSLRLVAETDGRELWKEQGWPQQRPTSQWMPSLQLIDTRTITLPTDTLPGFYRLDLSFVDPDSRDLLPAVTVPGDRYLGEIVPINYLVVGRPDREPAYRFPQPVLLGDKVALFGITPAPNDLATAAQGATLEVKLYWQGVAPMDTEYTGFVHLIAADGSLRAQDDHPPRHGFLPTTIWREGLIVSDPYRIAIPLDAPPGRYSLVAGMYDLASGLRLRRSIESGKGDDTVLLMQLDVH